MVYYDSNSSICSSYRFLTEGVMRKMIVMLAVMGLVFLSYDIYIIFSGNLNLDKHWPFLPTLACLMWAVLFWKADKYLD